MARFRTKAATALVALFVCCSSATHGARAAGNPLPASQDRVVEQTTELSCGPAALATILTYQFDDPVSDAEIVRALFEHVSPEYVEARHGFSLLDLKHYAESRGYEAVGYGNLTIEELAGLGPSIVKLHDGTLNHFVVFRGRRGGSVLLADPAQGTRSMGEAEFERIWEMGEAFVVRRPGENPTPGHLATTAADFDAVSAPQ